MPQKLRVMQDSTDSESPDTTNIGKRKTRPTAGMDSCLLGRRR
jgi:hypothetical protein